MITSRSPRSPRQTRSNPKALKAPPPLLTKNKPSTPSFRLTLRLGECIFVSVPRRALPSPLPSWKTSKKEPREARAERGSLPFPSSPGKEEGISGFGTHLTQILFDLLLQIFGAAYRCDGGDGCEGGEGTVHDLQRPSAFCGFWLGLGRLFCCFLGGLWAWRACKKGSRASGCLCGWLGIRCYNNASSLAHALSFSLTLSWA